jgi:P27 family predicted phage terminase small subunit
LKKPSHHELPPAPEHLSDEAAAWWAKITAEYQLGDDAQLLLQTGLESFDRMRSAQAEIAEHGVVVRDRWGQLRCNPACAVERDSRSALVQAMKALHLDLEPLNPVGRPPAGGL